MPTQALNKTARDEIHRRTLAAVRADLGDAAPLIGHCLEFAWQGYQIRVPREIRPGIVTIQIDTHAHHLGTASSISRYLSSPH